MGYLELFVSKANVFSGFQRAFDEADYVVLGVPFDVTSTYRSGARLGPSAIREASLNIETYSFRSSVDVENLRLHDLGDLHVSSDVEQTLGKLAKVVEEILKVGKTPVIIGGEHTITLGILKSLGGKASDIAILSFDAHLDLRDEFMGLRFSHTTFMRRISEQIRPAKILEVGTRAVCREELDYARKTGIDFLNAQQIRKDGVEQTLKTLKRRLANVESIYVTVDMDVLDPAYAPAVQNPEPDGLETHVLLDILCGVCDKRLVGFDVVEVAPNYDHGVTAIQAAKTIFEALCAVGKARISHSTLC